MRGRLHLGPALRQLRLPLRSTLLSAVFHVAFFGTLFYAAHVWRENQPKTYVVNLVPAVAAVGSPQGRPSLPPRPEELPQRPARASATELPQREAPRELPARDRGRDALALPERSLPPRATLPRAGDKELPPAASAPARAAAPPAAAPTAAAPRDEAPAPPQPLGQRAGSAAGAGALTLNVGDFPYAWYIRQIHQKIQEQWHGRAIPGQQPAVIFEIGRGGQLLRAAIDKTSGNPYYDQAALRAINNAHPFPPLPADFAKPVLTVGLQFAYDPTAGR